MRVRGHNSCPFCRMSLLFEAVDGSQVAPVPARVLRGKKSYSLSLITIILLGVSSCIQFQFYIHLSANVIQKIISEQQPYQLLLIITYLNHIPPIFDQTIKYDLQLLYTFSFCTLTSASPITKGTDSVSEPSLVDTGTIARVAMSST